jgi:hypothetical protein
MSVVLSQTKDRGSLSRAIRTCNRLPFSSLRVQRKIRQTASKNWNEQSKPLDFPVRLLRFSVDEFPSFDFKSYQETGHLLRLIIEQIGPLFTWIYVGGNRTSLSHTLGSPKQANRSFRTRCTFLDPFLDFLRSRSLLSPSFLFLYSPHITASSSPVLSSIQTRPSLVLCSFPTGALPSPLTSSACCVLSACSVRCAPCPHPPPCECWWGRSSARCRAWGTSRSCSSSFSPSLVGPHRGIPSFQPSSA